MIFKGISRKFSLRGEEQYHTIGAFWDEIEALYGLENLQGLGYLWVDGYLHYAIGFKDGTIPMCDFEMALPSEGWMLVEGETERLKEIYDEIYQDGPLKYEIETFTEDGHCHILYYR